MSTDVNLIVDEIKLQTKRTSFFFKGWSPPPKKEEKIIIILHHSWSGPCSWLQAPMDFKAVGLNPVEVNEKPPAKAEIRENASVKTLQWNFHHACYGGPSYNDRVVYGCAPTHPCRHSDIREILSTGNSNEIRCSGGVHLSVFPNWGNFGYFLLEERPLLWEPDISFGLAGRDWKPWRCYQDQTGMILPTASWLKSTKTNQQHLL